MLRPLAWLLCLLIACVALPGRAEVRLPDGEWYEQTDDLRVKVMGGYVGMARTWLENRWHFNPAWAPLQFSYDALNGEIAAIERTGWRYERRGAGVWAFDAKNTIVRTAEGFRWQDRQGNSIDFDTQGRIRSYADRNGVKVSLASDAVGRVTGVFDHFGRQVLWLDYAIAADQVLALRLVGSVDVSQPSAIRDASGRRVEYQYSDGRLTGVVDVLGHQWTYAYDGSGLLASRTDPENRVTRVGYANARVSSLTHADGTITAYGYDYDSARREIIVRLLHPGGRQETMWYGADGTLRRHEIAGQLRSELATDGRTLARTEANGARTKEEFDEWDNLVKRTHPDGSTEILEREPRFSEVSRYVDENGNETRYEYDANGNLIRRIDAVGRPETRTTEYQYDSHGNRTLARRLPDAVGAESTFSYAYDEAGNLITVTDAEGNVSRYGYDIQGNLLSFTDGLNRAWRYGYDAAGQLLTETDPLGQAAGFDYDKVGSVVSYTDRRGELWRFEYDAGDRLIAQIDPLGNTARTQYDPEGLPIREIDAHGRGQEVAYDPIRRLAGLRDGRGNVVELRYPQEPGNDTSSFAPSRIVYPTFEQEIRYDRRNRVTAMSDILGSEVRLTRYQYDKAGNRIATVNADNSATAYTYDALNRLVRITDTLGHVTGLAYDNRDNLIAVTDANGNAWRFEYDRSNRRTKEIKPLGEATWFRYDAADQLVELADAKGQHLLYDYDANGRLTKERHYGADPSASPPLKQIAYAYDSDGNLTGWTDGEHSVTVVYDAVARLSSETVDYGPFSLTYGYTYHASGLKKTLAYPDGTTYTYGYDAHNELASVEIPGEGSITVNAFQWTAPAQITLPGGAVQTHTWDGLLEPTRQEVISPAAQSLLSVTNEYGSRGQLVRREIDGIASDYSYDSETRLHEAVSSAGNRQTYTLDPVANRLADSAIPGPWEYDANNRLRRAGDTTYDYDANGNLTARTQGAQVTRFFYDVADRLIRVENGSGTVIARYGYDPMGRRLWKRAGESITYFLYAAEGLIGEYDALGRETSAYGWRPDGIWGTDPLFFKLDSRYFYAHTDHLGTPLRLTDKGGNVVWAATYAAFGEARVAASAIVDYNLRLPGQYFDAETGLHQNWLRYYDPRTGRYTQYDPLGSEGGINGFAYVHGDPLNAVDPRGDIAWFLIPVAIEGALVAYGKCVLQCGVEAAVVGLLLDGCVSIDDAGPCAKECLNPLNWIKLPGKKLKNRLANPTPGKRKLNLPFKDPKLRDQVRDVVDHYDKTGKPPPGVWQGGRKGHRPGEFLNDKGKLPAKPPGHYTESDVWQGKPGNRGPERLVFGKDGEVYYSPNHYDDFVRVR